MNDNIFTLNNITNICEVMADSGIRALERLSRK